MAQKLSDLGSWEHNHSTGELRWSDETYRIFGFEPHAVDPSYELFIDRVHPDDRERIENTFRESLEKQLEYNVIYRLQLPDKTIKYVEAHACHFYDEKGRPELTVGTNQNVTEREKEKRRLSETLETNKTLLGEIHHRLKNNLAIVAGMLQLQILQEEDPDTINALEDSANRIRSIASIHQQLYQSDHFKNISLGQNITELVQELIKTMDPDAHIELITDCEEIDLDINKSLPCSLLVNEVITNAIKHAFCGRSEGKIHIFLAQQDDQIRVEIQDNGVGLPDDFENRKGSLGMSLIDTLSQQLAGAYEFDSTPGEGTAFICTFSGGEA